MTERTQTVDADSLLGQVAGEFFDRLARGEQPDPEQYAKDHPQIAEHIRRTFPVMAVIGRSLSGGSISGERVELAQHRQLGDFRILREIGRGGMGVVYEAEQRSMGRLVALKVLPFVALVDAKPLQRFRNEVRAAATLQHPNIVPIYSVGEERGVHYYAMQLIRGQTLAQVIAELASLRKKEAQLDGGSISRIVSTAVADSSRRDPSVPTSAPPSEEHAAGQETQIENSSTTWPESTAPQLFRSIAAIGIQAASALQHAHEQGVVHRDIKPGNLMLDAGGQLWVTDFGLARIESDPGLTLTGDMVGTLRYMSPEQALGRQIVVDNRADIYSLSATLYEFLALRPVFNGRDRHQLLQQIASQEPLRLRRVDRHIPRDLETIIHKGLAKEPDRRYTTPQELADDLQRYLDNEPIRAQRPSLVHRAGKWMARHRSLVLLTLVALVAVAVTALAGTWAALWFAWDADQARSLAERRLTVAQRAERESQRATARARLQWHLSDMKLASDAFRIGDVPRVIELLERHRPQSGEEDLRGFAWHYLHQLVSATPTWEVEAGSEVHAICLLPGASLIAVATASRQVQIRQASDGDLLDVLHPSTEIRGLAATPQRDRLAGIGEDGRVYVWNYLGGSTLKEEDGRRPELVFPAHAGYDNNILISADGGTIWTCGDDGNICRWNADTGQRTLMLEHHQNRVAAIALSPDEKTLVSVSDGAGGDSISFWDVDAACRTSDWSMDQNISGNLKTVAYSADGSAVAAGDTRGHVILLDAKTHQGSIVTQVDGIESLLFLADSRRVVSGNRGGTVHVQLIAPNPDGRLRAFSQQLPRWKAHGGRVMALAATIDGNHVFSGSRDGWIACWPMEFEPRSNPIVECSDFDITHQGTLVAAEREIHHYDIAGRCWQESCWPASKGWERIDVADGSPRVAAAGSGVVAVYDLQLHRELARWEFRHDPKVIAISADGQFVAVAESDVRKRVFLFDVEIPDRRYELPAQQCGCIRFSPDGRYVAVGEMDDLLLYERASRKLRRRYAGHDSSLNDVAFSPDSTRLATVSSDRRLKLWDVKTGRTVYTAQANRSILNSVDYSDSGKLLVTAGLGGVIRVWRADTAQLLLEIPVDAIVEKVRFAADDQLVVAHLNIDQVVTFAAHANPGHPESVVRSAQPAELITLGEQAPGDDFPACGMSADGRVIVGNVKTDDATRPFCWTPAGGMTFLRLPDTFTGCLAVGVNADGQAIAGRFFTQSGATLPGRWPAFDQPPIVEPLPDGVRKALTNHIFRGTVTGYFLEEGSHRRVAFLHDGLGFARLPGFGTRRNTASALVATDRDLVIGAAWSRNGTQRNGAVQDLCIVRWHEGRAEPLPGFGNESYNWRPTGVSQNGSVVVGNRWPVGASPVNAQELAFRWEAGRVQVLGELPGGPIQSNAAAVSADGRIVVGRSLTGSTDEAFIWDATHGMRSLRNVLRQYGVDTRGWHIFSATAVSRDGTHIACCGRDPQGQRRLLLARLPYEACAP